MTQSEHHHFKNRRTRVASLADEYELLADEDEAVGRLLLAHNRTKHAAYFFAQAMEKLLCSHIFRMARGKDLRGLRMRVAHHKLDELVDEFVEVCLPSRSVDDLVSAQIRDQIVLHVLQGLRFGDLQNDLRYPDFERYGNKFGILEVNANEADFLLGRLEALRKFVKETYRARSSGPNPAGSTGRAMR